MKRNWRRGIIGGLSFTSALFIFQACYGMPQDFYPETLYSGLVKSKTSGQALGGIKVSIKDTPLYEFTNEEGEFMLVSEVVDQAILLFEDVDGEKNGTYASKDTVLSYPGDNVVLEIELEEN